MTESRSISVVVSAMSKSGACQMPGGRKGCVVRSDGGSRGSDEGAEENKDD